MQLSGTAATSFHVTISLADLSCFPSVYECVTGEREGESEESAAENPTYLPRHPRHVV